MNDLREQLTAIRKSHGRLTPEIVVEEARPEGHPLHARVFDRPPPEAAEAWYRQRAHEAIQSVRVRVARPDAESTIDIRAFVAVRDTSGGYEYQPVEDVVSDPFQRALALREMERDWRTLQRRWEDFEEFAKMVALSGIANREGTA